MRRALGRISVLAIAWLPAVPTAAQGLDAASATAFATTLQLLQDPAQRASLIAGNPQAATVDRQTQTRLGTRELQEEFYALAAAIFKKLEVE